MLLFYKFGICIYYLVIYTASFFNKKAKLWIDGRRKIIPNSDTTSIWFHFASLGEFEQGRPVLEKVRVLYPDDLIILTFFSPSGYEIRKNTPLADAVYYLPLDTAKNAETFVRAIKPKFAVFTKYEFWYHFFRELDQRQIPVYVISAIFRPGQVFFKWYGKLHRQILSFVSHFFVQDERSKQLLMGLGNNNVTISGDTRFDRVWENARMPKSIPFIEEFKNGKDIFIAGSTWPPDEKLLAALVTTYQDWKFIIAPHEINEEKINSFIGLLPETFVSRYSQIPNLIRQPADQISNLKVLIIDNIGILSSLYQYGNIAYIGGGFGAGIHNTLEAAAFGLPIIFGPKYSKFKEAQDMIALQSGFSIADEKSLQEITAYLITHPFALKGAGEKNRNYVGKHIGATDTIIEHITIVN